MPKLEASMRTSFISKAEPGDLGFSQDGGGPYMVLDEDEGVFRLVVDLNDGIIYRFHQDGVFTLLAPGQSVTLTQE